MKAKLKEQKKAKGLRQKGFSYNEIAKRLNVAKSSISLWCRDIKLSKKQRDRLKKIKLKGAARGRETMREMKHSWRKNKSHKADSILSTTEVRRLYWKEKFSVNEIADKFDVSYWMVYNFMKRNNIPRRTGSESNYATNRYKPQFNVKENLTPEEENLRITGIMLYWAEGAKNGHMVDFVNSDPNMIKLFLAFLRKICRISEERLGIYLYGYSYQNINKLKKYWSELTNIPLNQFTKPYIRKGNPNKSKRKLPHGLVHVRYSDKKLLTFINKWISEYTAKVLSS